MPHSLRMASGRRGPCESVSTAQCGEISRTRRARIALMEKETDERVQDLAKLPPEQRVVAAEDLIEELERELELASSTPEGDPSPVGDPGHPVENDDL